MKFITRQQLLFLAAVAFRFCSPADNSSSRITWMSHHFILPGRFTWLGVKCRDVSQHFCLYSILYDHRFFINRMPLESDLEVFESVIRHSFTSINWYSMFQSNDSESCCEFQSFIYKNHGWRKGVSPELFLDHVFDFSLTNKQVNYIYATYAENLCHNVITEVGFGPGKLRLNGRILQNTPFIFPIQNTGEIKFIPANYVRSSLTYNWFRSEIICAAQPWICEWSTENV
ncbi:uncharacterized protein LOC142341101 [Convolutriloba macropyga]|uniref:uncharacterized protein LOC142341101 n=1 Tax=Convolutriloba macropyga TaxID=536237 RepID=UPI003F51D924